jgi:hypothetical protein
MHVYSCQAKFNFYTGLNLQVFAVISIITSSVCLNKLPVTVVEEDSNDYLRKVDSHTISNTRAAAGWILFLSLVAYMYQSFAFFQLFFYLKLLYIKIPVGKSLWYLFPLMVNTNPIYVCDNNYNAHPACIQQDLLISLMSVLNRIPLSWHCDGCVLLPVYRTGLWAEGSCQHCTLYPRLYIASCIHLREFHNYV